MPALQGKASQGLRVAARQTGAADLTSKDSSPTVHTKKEQSRIIDSNQSANSPVIARGKGVPGNMTPLSSM